MIQLDERQWVDPASVVSMRIDRLTAEWDRLHIFTADRREIVVDSVGLDNKRIRDVRDVAGLVMTARSPKAEGKKAANPAWFK